MGDSHRFFGHIGILIKVSHKIGGSERGGIHNSGDIFPLEKRGGGVLQKTSLSTRGDFLPTNQSAGTISSISRRKRRKLASLYTRPQLFPTGVLSFCVVGVFVFHTTNYREGGGKQNKQNMMSPRYMQTKRKNNPTPPKGEVYKNETKRRDVSLFKLKTEGRRHQILICGAKRSSRDERATKASKKHAQRI